MSSVSHISDSLNKLIGDDMCDPSKATLSVSIDKLEALASKVSRTSVLGYLDKSCTNTA